MACIDVKTTISTLTDPDTDADHDDEVDDDDANVNSFQVADDSSLRLHRYSYEASSHACRWLDSSSTYR